ncbi:acylphosphatase [Methylobacterium sp. Leaf466]|uniref:acylphosphatase n=1 Tax=Methylobacterium sp. Leaf466 TaxID=1736386 RepID=UPI0006F2D266|nr:acylphosphatase [Methylobacterium sp. Leaf466]KQT78752.1 acylphosphatase [Methylobacterium sp. Leaf466]
MTQTRTVQVVIRGRVQGVGYRYWTRDEALRRALSGHVRNRVDGAVEALFSGPAEGVSTMIEACRRGPPGARVDDIVVAEVESMPSAEGFAILSD